MNKTLVCVVCQTRSWELTWPGFKHNVLDTLHADLALCIGVPQNYNYQNPFWQHAKYKITFPEYDDWGDAFDYAQDVELNFVDNKPYWRKLLDLDGRNWLGGIKHNGSVEPGSGAMVTTARWHLLQFIKNERIFDRYDRIILTRSDYMHSIPHPYPMLLDPKYIWIPDGEGYGGLTDRHVILSKYNYEVYLGLLTTIVTRPDELLTKMTGFSWNFERFMKFNIFDQKAHVKCYPYHMYTVRQSNDHTTWAKGSYHSEHGHYIKYEHEYHATTSLAPYVQTQKDWDNIINKCTFENCFNAFVLTSNNNYITYDSATDTYIEVTPEQEPQYIMVMDHKNGQGELLMSSVHTGLFERYSLQKIIVVENNPTYFVMETLDTREKIFMHNNYLSKGYDLSGSNAFKLKNRFDKVITR